MWEWISTWNFFNWLTLIAFLLTIYNVFLKSYVVEWLNTRNKLAFENRLLEIDVTIRCFEKYREEPHLLFLYLLVIAVKPLTYLLISFGLFFMSVSLFFPSPNSIPQGSYILGAILINTAVILIYPSILLLGRITNAILYFEHPDVLFRVRKRLLLKAEKKGLASKEDLEKFKSLQYNEEVVDKVTYKSLIPSK